MTTAHKLRDMKVLATSAQILAVKTSFRGFVIPCGGQMKVVTLLEPPQGEVIEEVWKHFGGW